MNDMQPSDPHLKGGLEMELWKAWQKTKYELTWAKPWVVNKKLSVPCMLQRVLGMVLALSLTLRLSR